MIETYCLYELTNRSFVQYTWRRTSINHRGISREMSVCDNFNNRSVFLFFFFFFYKITATLQDRSNVSVVIMIENGNPRVQMDSTYCLTLSVPVKLL